MCIRDRFRPHALFEHITHPTHNIDLSKVDANEKEDFIETKTKITFGIFSKFHLVTLCRYLLQNESLSHAENFIKHTLTKEYHRTWDHCKVLFLKIIKAISSNLSETNLKLQGTQW